MIDLNLNPSRKELKQFALFQLLFCLLVSGWLCYKYHSETAATFLTAGSVLIFIAGKIKPELLRGLFVFLIIITFPIGYVVSHVIILLVYYLLMVPIGLIMKCVGYDPLHRSIDKNSESYWIKKPVNKSNESYFRQY